MNLRLREDATTSAKGIYVALGFLLCLAVLVAMSLLASAIVPVDFLGGNGPD